MLLPIHSAFGKMPSNSPSSTRTTLTRLRIRHRGDYTPNNVILNLCDENSRVLTSERPQVVIEKTLEEYSTMVPANLTFRVQGNVVGSKVVDGFLHLILWNWQQDLLYLRKPRLQLRYDSFKGITVSCRVTMLVLEKCSRLLYDCFCQTSWTISRKYKKGSTT